MPPATAASAGTRECLPGERHGQRGDAGPGEGKSGGPGVCRLPTTRWLPAWWTLSRPRGSPALALTPPPAQIEASKVFSKKPDEEVSHPHRRGTRCSPTLPRRWSTSRPRGLTRQSSRRTAWPWARALSSPRTRKKPKQLCTPLWRLTRSSRESGAQVVAGGVPHRPPKFPCWPSPMARPCAPWCPPWITSGLTTGTRAPNTGRHGHHQPPTPSTRKKWPRPLHGRDLPAHGGGHERRGPPL